MPQELQTVTELEQNIARVQESVARAEVRSGRPAGSVTVVAVSKTVERAAIDGAYRLGLRHFGENRVQDAVAKYQEALPADSTLHLIGQLQSNKARPAADLFDVIESVDRPSLIDALARATVERERPLSVLLQVNVARETQKAGCDPQDAVSLVEAILAHPSLELRGVMTIAPLVEEPEDVRPVFSGLRLLRDDLRQRFPTLPLEVLSMGMSNDFAVAIEEGATHVRVGRAIFHG